MSSGSSIGRSGTAGRSNGPTNGCDTAIPGQSPPEITLPVKFGGRTESYHDERGRYQVRWIPDQVVMGVANDTPVAGYHVNTVNLLRLWTAQACESFDFDAFNKGEYYRAVDEKVRSENITKASTRTTKGSKGSVCGSSSNTSSCPVRCRT